MTDESISSSHQQAAQTGPVSKKEEKRPASGGGGGQNNGNRKRNASRTTSMSASNGNANVPRPSSRASNKSINKKGPSNPPTGTESGSESRKGNEPRRNEQRGKSQGGANARGSGHRKGQSSAQNRQGGNKPNVPQPKQQSNSPAPPTIADNSDALSSLQRVINDLKTTPNPSSTPNAQTSNLPANAPVFQPGASAFPGTQAQNEQPPRHRKAASLGTAGNPAYNSYSPNLGSMMEDVEEGQSFPMEEGEINEGPYPAGHQRRSLSQSFTAPRFAALAAQQEGEVVGPTGRPQLAPGFMFGARRRPSQSLNTPMGPPINEEDVGFQFPQQQQQQNFDIASGEMNQRKNDGGPEISGIMAEQVSAKLSVMSVYS